MLFVASPLFILLFSLFLIFLSLINVNLGMFLLGFILYGTLSFLVFSECFIFYVRNIFNSNLWKYFLRPFLSLFCFWESCNVNVGSFNVVPEVSETVFISFFFLPYSMTVIATTLSSSTLTCYSTFFILLLTFSSVFCISVIVLFISVCLFFKYFSSLLNISYIFLVCVSSLI